MHQRDRDLVIVVDMLEGFINQGALASPDVKRIVEPLAEVLGRLDCRKVFVCDAHSSDAAEFSDFPPHCIIGTGEERIVEELQPFVDEVYLKNSVNAFQAPDFRTFMEREVETYDHVWITGCCTDICVLNLALALKTWFNEENLKKKVTVVRDLVETYDAPGHDRDFENQSAFSILKTNGVGILTSEALLPSSRP